MTLYEIINQLTDVALSQPAINQVVENDVFLLNGIPDTQYGVFAYVQNAHSADINRDFITYNFSLFYIDRLLADKSNKNEIQSTGIQVLTNIARSFLDDAISVAVSTIQPFNQRFKDECSGVFMNVAITTTIDYTCLETFN